jgi:hypothetical protein
VNTNDPIEELFRARGNEAVGEKPRDLVWKRIESGLKESEKKKKPVREFISSVWFSAAVFALIAIPYFVLFIENLNSAQNKSDSVEFVKTSTETNQTKSSKSDDLDLIESRDAVIENGTEIVKNDKVIERPIYKVIEGVPTPGASKVASKNNSAEISLEAPASIIAPQIAEERSKILDSIEKSEQFAVKVNKTKDSLITPKSALKSKDTSAQMKMAVVSTNSNTNNKESNAIVAQVSPKKGQVNKSEISFKPLVLTVKTDILRTNFKLLKRNNRRVLLQNKSIIVSFEKVNNTIILSTNEPYIDPVLLGTFEKNKREIFNYYQKTK